MLKITKNTFSEDVIEIKEALTQMHSTGWSHKQYMRFQLRCYKNQGYSQEDIDYAKRVFIKADNNLRELPVQEELF